MEKLFDIHAAISYFPKILARLDVTLLIVLTAIFIGIILAVVLAIVRLYKIPVLNQITLIYISFIRGTPIIIQLFIVYYGLPMILTVINIEINQWDKMYFVIVTYGLNLSAFLAEIFRSSISSVPKGQSEAAYSVGLTKLQTMFTIIIPQALITSLPAFSTTLISLLKNTSIAFALGIADMLGEVQIIGANTMRTLEGYVDVAIIFLVLTVILERSFYLLEKKLVIKKHV